MTRQHSRIGQLRTRSAGSPTVVPVARSVLMGPSPSHQAQRTEVAFAVVAEGHDETRGSAAQTAGRGVEVKARWLTRGSTAEPFQAHPRRIAEVRRGVRPDEQLDRGPVAIAADGGDPASTRVAARR